MESNPFIRKSSEAHKCKVIGFNRRLVATLIDGLILFTGTFLLVLAVGLIGVYLNIYSNDEMIPVDRLTVIFGLLLSIFYYVGAWSKSGQTIAKSVLGIKVVGLNGQPLSVGRALLRYLGYIVSALPLSLGFLWIVFDKQRQGWHDKIASSYAIDGDTDVYGQENIEFVPADSKPGWVWLLIWFLIAMVAPAALLSSLFILGPSLSRIITNLLVN
jgi:uncharacterized RDD family membrane protein YckC